MIKMLYDEEPINKKYIFIGISIFILLITITAGIVIFTIQHNKARFTTVMANNQKLSIKIPSSIKYRINPSKSNEFIIDLFSEEDEMYMYATTITKKRELDLLEVATDDKISYFKNKENIRDDSGYNEIEIFGNKAIEYNLVYYDSEYKKDFYCNVLWIETNDTLYIFNFEVVNKNAQKYKDIFNNIKNSIVFY